MNGQINQLVKSLLQKDSLDQCSVQELQQFADRHPYFGAAQLLLTKKLQTENADQYQDQLQKTFLFFHNPLWVEQLLSETGHATITKASPAVADQIIKQGAEAVEITKQETEPAEPVMPAAETLENIPGIPAPVLTTAVVPGVKTDKDLSSKEELLIEPFYMVDYFASQGIKFREEEKPKDKFGQQLKSFTEWLKTLKRLPATAIAEVVEPKAEQKVEQLAEHSLEDREVLTEAMAEVWEKQGNAEKAVAIYNKLSLLDPAKSAYFAAKIEELKKRI